MTHQLEVRVVEQMQDVFFGASEEIIQADDIVAVVQQALTEVRAEEASAAGDQAERAVGVVFHSEDESLKKTVFMVFA